jgi:hypothetical protein
VSVVVTGVLHIHAGLVEGWIPVALAGVGSAGALVLLSTDHRRRPLSPIGGPDTTVPFPLRIVAKSAYGTTDRVDGAVQVAPIRVSIDSCGRLSTTHVPRGVFSSIEISPPYSEMVQ